jgi:hypothetical protein
MNAGPLSNLDAFYGKDNEFWQQLKEHSSYDDFLKKRHSATLKRYQACCNDCEVGLTPKIYTVL